VKKVSAVVPVTAKVALRPEKAALVLCDVWDDHWCKAAAGRCDGLAKRIADVVADARKQGFTVIHCPSDTMDFYKDSPARKRAQAAPKADPPKNKDLPDPPLPIDDSDGGCDDAAPVKPFKAWSRQHAAIKVDGDKDYVTDSGAEVYNVLKGKGIETVFVMGVHTNMCVLNRSFAIKQLRRWDVTCYLVRDLTDAMYNPKMKPLVTHAEGTGLVIAHIETHWCPSVTADQLLAPKE
jgi:nicotinamidase-related amidase